MPQSRWYHESFVREDFTLEYAKFEKMFDFHFFPDKADAEKHGGEWLPLGVDSNMFNRARGCYYPKRDIPVAFIGLMYPKRARFVEELKPHLGDIEIQYRVAQQSERGLIPAISVFDFDGLNIRHSMCILADTYRRIEVFVTFPSLSNVLVAKVLESMACGCKLVAPRQPVELNGYFPYQGVYQCAQQIRKALASDVTPDVSEHRMELRFERIFQKAGLCATSSPEPVASLVTT
jgi:hypothetical protein